MNMLKNTNKQGEKILLSGVAAAALGLINAKPQAVKAATLNGNRATKKTTRRTVKTKLNYQTETDSETAGETATADPADQDSGSQTKVNTADSTTSDQDQNFTTNTNDNTASETTQGPSTASNSQADKKEQKTDQFDPAAATRTIHTGTWASIKFTWDTDGTLTLVPGDSITFNGNYSDPSPISIQHATLDNNDPYHFDPLGFNVIQRIVVNGKFKVDGNAHGMFANLKYLTSITGLDNIDFSGADDMSSLFQDDEQLTSIGGLDKLKTQRVTNVAGMFEDCYALENVSLPSSFNFSQVKYMNAMFDNCKSLKSITFPSNIDTSKVINMNGMFNGCKNLTSIDVSHFDTENVLAFVSMFQGCSNLTTLDISSFDMSKAAVSSKDDKVYGLSNMLEGLTGLTKLILGPKCILTKDGNNVGFDTPTTWVNQGLGNPDLAKNTNIWSPTELMENYEGSRDYDTYTKYTGGIVRIHRHDENGQPLVDENNKQIPDQFLFGNEGDLIDEKQIDRSNFPNSGYSFKEIENFPEGGKFTSKEQIINALYTTINGNVTVQYRDEQGKPLVDQNGQQIPAKQLQGRISTPWTIGAPYFKGYAFVNATDRKGNTGITSGKYKKDPQIITLNYTSEAKPATIKYRDESGKLIAEDEEINGKIDEPKIVKPKKITGYTIKSIFINDVKQDSTEQAAFTLNENPQTILFVYTKNSDNPGNKVPAANVTVHYRDENGNNIAPDVILTGYVGDSYVSEAKVIPGYTLKIRPNNATGVFSSYPQDITYVYSKNNTNTVPNVPNVPNVPSVPNVPNVPNVPPINNPGNNDQNNTPTPVNRKPKTGKHHKTINKHPKAKIKNEVQHKQSNNSLKHNSLTPNAQNNASNTLPQTGNDKHNNLAMLALGSLALATALGAAWFGRKKD